MKTEQFISNNKNQNKPTLIGRLFYFALYAIIILRGVEMDKVYLLLEIIEDIEEYGEDYPVYAIYENDLISDYWYVDEPEVGLDMEGTEIVMEHYEELDCIDKDSVREMSLLELLNRLRVQVEGEQ